VTEEGSKIIATILQDWTTRCLSDEDDPMDDEAQTNREVSLLKESVERSRDSIYENPWIQSLIAAL